MLPKTNKAKSKINCNLKGFRGNQRKEPLKKSLMKNRNPLNRLPIFIVWDVSPAFKSFLSFTQSERSWGFLLKIPHGDYLTKSVC